MTKAVLNSSVIIALSTLGYLDKLRHIFAEVLVARAVYEEICVGGCGLIGERELLDAVNNGLIVVGEVKNRLLVDALLDPLAMGEAETIALAVEEEANCIVIDEKLVRLQVDYPTFSWQSGVCHVSGFLRTVVGRPLASMMAVWRYVPLR